MIQSPFKFCVFFHKGREDIGQIVPCGAWHDARRSAEKEAAMLQFQLTHEQREKGYRYSVRPIAQSYRPLWRPVIKAV